MKRNVTRTLYTFAAIPGLAQCYQAMQLLFTLLPSVLMKQILVDIAGKTFHDLESLHQLRVDTKSP